MMTSLSRDLVFLILQFLDEEKFEDTIHHLEKESGVFFSMKYFEELVLGGKWDELERYLSGFTRLDDNRFSMKLFFEIRKQKYLEALDNRETPKAVDILVKDLKVFAHFNEDLYKEITQLLTFDNFRENDQLSSYRDARTARTMMMVELKRLIEANPLFREKLQFPAMRGSRLRLLINQSLNWQHSLCANPRQNPDIRTLLTDHVCRNTVEASMQLTPINQLTVSGTRPEGYIPVGGNGSFEPVRGQAQPSLRTWGTTPGTPPVAPRPIVSGPGTTLPGPLNLATTPREIVDLENDSPMVISPSDRTTNPVNDHGSASNGSSANVSDELPMTVARTLNQGAVPTSVHFHPIQQTLLLVGNAMGDVILWEVSTKEKLVSRSFQVWDVEKTSMQLKALLVKDPRISVKRVLWSPDGSIFGVGFSEHMVQLYSYSGGNDIRPHFEIDSHIGGVNDLAFCTATGQLLLMTCGDDKSIKAWDMASGAKVFSFEGHAAPVYSICPHQKENVHFFFSTSTDGKIKAWLFDTMGSRVDYDAPGHSTAAMVYTADGKRLFSCGKAREGESVLVEWNENEGTVKRVYQGLAKTSADIAQFDTTRSRFLVVGDEFSIKFWDMDNIHPLAVTKAGGGLLGSPVVRFNKDGNLLAVTADQNEVRILASVDGLRLMRTRENQSLLASRAAVETPANNQDARNLGDSNPRLTEEANAGKLLKQTEISHPTQLRSLRLSSHILSEKIIRLLYNHSGTAILALASNGIHQLWKWPRVANVAIKATAKVNPYFAQAPSGAVMANDLIGSKKEETIPCLALSKNDSYLMSASGGKISLFNMMTFKVLTNYMPPPPAATCIVFHPDDNNILAVGLDDSTIQIYNVRVNAVKHQLIGHSKRVTGLAFSSVLHALVSSADDSQIIIWSTDKWEKRNSCLLLVPAGRATTSAANSGAQLQYSFDQVHLLAVNETQISVYDTIKLQSVKQWVTEESSPHITYATFSCDGELIYCSSQDGTIRVFGSPNLNLRCQINPSAYLPSEIINFPVSPLVVAAHPQEPNQFAVGLTDGHIHVVEPLQLDGKWGQPTPALENRLTSHASPPPPPPVPVPDQPQPQPQA